MIDNLFIGRHVFKNVTKRNTKIKFEGTPTFIKTNKTPIKFTAKKKFHKEFYDRYHQQ